MKTAFILFGILGSLIAMFGAFGTMIGGFSGATVGAMGADSEIANSSTKVFWSGVLSLIISFIALIVSIIGGSAKSKNNIMTFSLVTLIMGVISIYLYNWISGLLIFLGGLLGLLAARAETEENQKPIKKSILFIVMMITSSLVIIFSIFIKNMDDIIESEQNRYKQSKLTTDTPQTYTEPEKKIESSLKDSVYIQAPNFQSDPQSFMKPSYVKFNGNTIYTSEPAMFLYLEEIIELTNEKAYIISESTGGNGVLPDYFIVIVDKHKKHKLMDKFYSNTSLKTSKIDENTIKIDLGSDGEKTSQLTYSKGIQRVVTEENQTNKSVSSSSCTWLYTDIYQAFINKRACNTSVEEVSGMATFRDVFSIVKNEGLDKNKLISESVDSCIKNEIIPYQDFKRKICN